MPCIYRSGPANFSFSSCCRSLSLECSNVCLLWCLQVFVLMWHSISGLVMPVICVLPVTTWMNS